MFIFYTLQEVQETLRCGHNKATRLFHELEQYGLIERVRQGQGKPAKIYVKNFAEEESPEQAEGDKADLKTSEKSTCRLPVSKPLDCPKDAIRLIYDAEDVLSFNIRKILLDAPHSHLARIARAHGIKGYTRLTQCSLAAKIAKLDDVEEIIGGLSSAAPLWCPDRAGRIFCLLFPCGDSIIRKETREVAGHSGVTARYVPALFVCGAL